MASGVPALTLEARSEPVWPVFAAWLISAAAILGTTKPIVAALSPPGRVALPAVFVLSFRLAAVLVVAAVAVTRPPRKHALRLGLGRLTGQHVFVVALGGAAVGQAVGYASALLSPSGENRASWRAVQDTLTAARGSALVALLLAIGLLSAGCQDLFFRGAMQTRLTHRWGPVVGVLATSACFGLFQMQPSAIAQGFLLGLYAGALTELADSVWAGIAAHAAHNTLATGLAPVDQPGGPGNAGLALLCFGIAAAAFVWLRSSLAARGSRRVPA